MRTRKQTPSVAWALAVVGAVLLLAGVLVVWSRLAESRDLAGAPEQYGMAVVEEVGVSPPDRFARQRRPVVMLRFRGELVMPRRVVRARWLREGGRARIAYRVGKSGRLYVDRAEPAEAESATPP